MTAQKKISYSWQKLFVGMAIDVLVERVERKCSYREALEVDGVEHTS